MPGTMLGAGNVIYFIVVTNNCVRFDKYYLLFTSQTQFDIFYVKNNFPSEFILGLKIYIRIVF